MNTNDTADNTTARTVRTAATTAASSADNTKAVRANARTALEAAQEHPNGKNLRELVFALSHWAQVDPGFYHPPSTHVWGVNLHTLQVESLCFHSDEWKPRKHFTEGVKCYELVEWLTSRHAAYEAADTLDEALCLIEGHPSYQLREELLPTLPEKERIGRVRRMR